MSPTIYLLIRNTNHQKCHSTLVSKTPDGSRSHTKLLYLAKTTKAENEKKQRGYQQGAERATKEMTEERAKIRSRELKSYAESRKEKEAQREPPPAYQARDST